MNEIRFLRTVSLSDRVGILEPISVVQDDNEIPVAAITLTDKGNPYTIPAEAKVFVKMRKPDGKKIYNEITKSGNMVLVPFTAQMTAAEGKCFMIIELLEGEKAKNSQPIPLSIEKNAVSNSDIISEDEMLNIHELLEKYQLWIENLPRINDAGNWEIYNPDLPGYEDSGVKATGFSFKGEYDEQTQYERMDVLTYQGSSFVALKTVQGIVPSDDKQNYTMLAKGGKDGKSAYQYAKEGGFEGTEEEFRQYQTDIVLAKEAAEQVANEIIPEFKTFLEGEKQQVTDSAQSAEQSAQRAENAAQTATQAQSTATAKSEEAAQSAAKAETEANRAKSEADRAAQIAGNLGWFPTPEKLKEKHPTGQDGWIAVIGQTDTVWTWDSDTGAWVDTKGNGVGDYNRLTNQPQINGITLAGNKSLTELGIQAKGEYISQTALNLALAEKANKDLSDIENSVFLEKGKAAGLLDKESAGNTYSTKEEVKTELGSLSNSLNNHMEQTYAKKEETVNKIVTVTIPPERWTDSGEGIYKAEISEFAFKANEKLNLAPNDDSTISQLIADGVAALVAKNESNTQLTGGAAVLAYQNKPSKAIGLQIEIIKTTEG